MTSWADRLAGFRAFGDMLDLTTLGTLPVPGSIPVQLTMVTAIANDPAGLLITLDVLAFTTNATDSFHSMTSTITRFRRTPTELRTRCAKERPNAGRFPAFSPKEVVPYTEERGRAAENT